MRNGCGWVTGTSGSVASNTARPSSSSPLTGTASHCAARRTVAGPNTHRTGGAPSSAASKAAARSGTSCSSTWPSGRTFTIHCSGSDQITPGRGGRGNAASAATTSGDGRTATDSRVMTSRRRAAAGSGRSAAR